MIVRYLTADKRMTIEIDAETMEEVFIELGYVQEVLEGLQCPLCNNPVRLQHRRAMGRGNKPYDYYEKRCVECRATLSFGKRQDDGHLFPKRKDADGNWKENGGWEIWQGKGQKPAPAQEEPEDDSF